MMRDLPLCCALVATLAVGCGAASASSNEPETGAKPAPEPSSSAGGVMSAPQSSTEQPPNQGAIQSDQDAIEAFERGWHTDMLPALQKTRPRVASHLRSILASELDRRATILSCDEHAATLRDGSLTPQSVLFGTVDTLSGVSSCWWVILTARLESLQGAILPEDGQLLLVVWPPEG